MNKTGGQAFPDKKFEGMTLRDYFFIRIYCKLMERYLQKGYSDDSAMDEAWKQS